MNNLKIIHWNANGITHKINELKALIAKLKINIILLSETRISQKTKLKIPNFFTYRTDNPPKRGSPPSGGTAILVHRNIIHQQELIKTSLQSTSIKIKLGDIELLVSAIYKPPSLKLSPNDLNLLTNHSQWFIAAGDYNAKNALWHSRTGNAAGNILFHHVSQNDYNIIGPDTPTHFPSSPLFRPDVLDIALTRIPLQIQVSNLSDLSSDHNPILLEISDSPITKAPPVTGRAINWLKYSKILSQDKQPTKIALKTNQNIEDEIAKFTNLIHSTIDACAYTPNARKTRNSLPDSIINEITEKNRIRREWQASRDPRLKKILNSKIKFIRSMLEVHRNDEWDAFLDTLNFKDGSLYKLNRSLLKKIPASHPITGPLGLAFSATEKAEILADTLANQFTNNPGPIVPDVASTIQALNGTDILCSGLFTTPGTVLNLINKLPKKKAPGEDLISNAALRHLPSNKITSLTEILNACLRTCYFPSTWKRAVIIPIPKPGKDHKIPENYRPIALLSSLSKVYEKVILKKIHEVLAGKIRNEQFAFRPDHSTTLQLVKLLDDLSTNWNNNEHSAAIFLDVAKAFDKVWHEGLLYKLSVLNTPTTLIKIVQSFLSNRFFAVKIEGQISTMRSVAAGLPQGSCLSPFLFNLYTNDMPVHPKSQISLFADDTMLLSKNVNPNFAAYQLQKQIDISSTWYTKWRLKINESKSVAVIFGRKNSQNIRPITINGQTIKWSSNAKYLGVTIDRKIRVTKHIQNITKKATQVRGILYPLLNTKSPIPIKAKISILRTYVLPILSYAGAAWAPYATKTQWKQIEAVQTIGLRTITGLPKFVRNKILLHSTNSRNIEETIKRQSTAMFYKNSKSPYPHIRNLGCDAAHIETSKPKIRPIMWTTQTT